MLKTDNEGDTTWIRVFDNESVLEEYGQSVLQTSDGGYIVVGSRAYILSIIKTDVDGNIQWSKSYYEDGGISYGPGYCIQQTTDGNYVLVCESFPPEFAWLMKLDTEGNILWAKKFGSEKQFYLPYSMQQTTDQGYIIVGAMESEETLEFDAWLIKTDENGDTLWSRIYGGEGRDWGRCVQQTPDGGYVIAGYTESYGHGGYDLWLFKVDSLGEMNPTTVDESPPQSKPDWRIISSCGPNAILKYSDMPDGFHAEVFDASGRRVDEINSSASSGFISWGKDKSNGIYFISVFTEDSREKIKVVLTK